MKKMLFVVLVAMLVVAMFLPIARAGPVMDPTEDVFLASIVPTANSMEAEKVGIVTQLSMVGLSAYARRDLEVVRGYQSREWVRNRSERVRITKWPGVVVASTLGSFNLAKDAVSSGNSIYDVDRA